MTLKEKRGVLWGISIELNYKDNYLCYWVVIIGIELIKKKYIIFL